MIIINKSPVCPHCQVQRFHLEYQGQSLRWCPACGEYEGSGADLTQWASTLKPTANNAFTCFKHQHFQHHYYLNEFQNALRNLLSSCGSQLPAQSLWEKPVAIEHGTFVDPRDQQRYRTVRIGTQNWMAQNLNFLLDERLAQVHHDDMESIPDGLFYDWESALLAPPPGWHLPQASEWEELCAYIAEHSPVAQWHGHQWLGVGYELKGPHGWRDTPANRFGFTAQCTGLYSEQGICIDPHMACWWTSNEACADSALQYATHKLYPTLCRQSFPKRCRCTVRCVQDKA